MYGTQIKEGYQYRAVIAAMKRYADDGKFTYVLGHCAAPTKKATLNSKRKQFVKEFETIHEVMKICGLKVFPIKVMGFLPQDREKENLKVLVKPEDL